MKTGRFRGLAVAVTMAIRAGPALADSHGDHDGRGGHDTMMDEMADMDGVSGTGTINAIDAGGRNINLSHDPIPVAGMPAMTMDMAVADGVMLHDLTPGTAA